MKFLKNSKILKLIKVPFPQFQNYSSPYSTSILLNRRLIAPHEASTRGDELRNISVPNSPNFGLSQRITIKYYPYIQGGANLRRVGKILYTFYKSFPKWSGTAG